MFRILVLITYLVTVVAQKQSPKETKINELWRNINFNKFAWIPYSQPMDVSFPLTNAQAAYLQQNSGSVSIVVPGPEEECSDEIFREVIGYLERKKLSPPLRPGYDKKFWLEFDEVVSVQNLLKQWRSGNIDDRLHEIMPIDSLPELWKNYSIGDVSQAVNDEYPGIYHAEMIAKWLKDGLKTNDLIPKSGNVDFLRGPVFFF